MDWEGIRLFAFDLDGTVISDDHLGGEAPHLLRAYAEGGGRVVVASGRQLPVQLEMLRRSAVAPAAGFPHHIISCDKFIHRLDGQGYVDDERWNLALRRRWERVLPQVRARDAALFRAFDRAGLSHEPLGDEAFDQQTAYHAIAFSDVPQAEQAMTIMAAVYADIYDVAINRNSRFAAATLRAAGKGEALMAVVAGLRLAPRQVCAIGDSFNDLTMLDGRYGFRSAAVANAEGPVKDAVRRNDGYIAAGVTAAGFCEVLAQVLAAAGRLDASSR